MELMYVIVGGYVASGSSIVCDLLGEVDGVGTLGGSREFKLLKEPFGLIELERIITEEWNWIRVNEAIRRFIWLYKKMGNPRYNVYDYSAHINSNFMKISEDYVKSITQFRYDGGSSVFSIMDGLWYSGIKDKLMRRLHNRVSAKMFPIPTEQRFFSSLSKDEFIELSQKYMDDIFYEKWGGECTHLCLDQALYPYDAHHLNDFFKNAKMIIVERNPLDQLVSLIEKKKAIGPEMAVRPDAQKYILWLAAANRVKKADENILYISYEDAILNYDENVKKIFNFLEIDPSRHIRKKELFDPAVSKKRMGKWKKYVDDHPQYRKMFLEVEDYYFNMEK